MIQTLLNMLDGLGMTGVLIVMAIEGSSFPFPGVFLVVTYGYLLQPTLPKLLGLAFVMSVVYSVSSYVPYAIGFKLETAIPKRFKQKLVKAQHVFRKYGLWSVALTRPLGVGNYISYVAGMCKVNGWMYGLLTLLGVFPWAVGMLWLGCIFKGNVAAIARLFHDYQWYLYAVVMAAILAYVTVFLVRRNRRIMRSASERGGSDR